MLIFSPGFLHSVSHSMHSFDSLSSFQKWSLDSVPRGQNGVAYAAREVNELSQNNGIFAANVRKYKVTEHINSE